MPMRKHRKMHDFFSTNKKELENGKIVLLKIGFIDSLRFMSSSLSHLTDDLAEGLHNNKCKYCKSCLEYLKVKDELLIFICSDCNKNYKNKFDKDLTKRFADT